MEPAPSTSYATGNWQLPPAESCPVLEVAAVSSLRATSRTQAGQGIANRLLRQESGEKDGGSVSIMYCSSKNNKGGTGGLQTTAEIRG